MSKREAITRYNLIVKKLRKQPATFAEISDYLTLESDLQGYNFSISKRTFQRDIEDISSLYNIEILYDFRRKVYFIDFEEQPDVTNRLVEAFDTFNALNIVDRLSDFIHFEKRRPQGTENLYGLLHAIQNNLQVVFSYKKFWESENSFRTVEPYALKEFKNRWYILANDFRDKRIKTFALDRLSDLEITYKKFQLPNNFNVNDHFKYCFGITSPNEHKPQEIILSFNSFQGKYIKSLPLHETQEVLNDTDSELIIKLTLFITHDFLMEILSFGDNVKVIQPEKLISDLKDCYKRALNQY